MFGALKIMVGAVRARRQEIGTLRALGFGACRCYFGRERVSVAGVDWTLIGSAIAWLTFDGAQGTYWETLFDLKVTPGLIGLGILWALAIALLGAWFPPSAPRGFRLLRRCGGMIETRHRSCRTTGSVREGYGPFGIFDLANIYSK